MKTVGLGIAYDQLKPGDRFRTLGRTLTETDLVNFINATGMVEVLFTDIEYAREHAPQGGRLVPGALVYAVAEGLLVQAILQRTGLAFLSMEFEIRAPRSLCRKRNQRATRIVRRRRRGRPGMRGRRRQKRQRSAEASCRRKKSTRS